MCSCTQTVVQCTLWKWSSKQMSSCLQRHRSCSQNTRLGNVKMVSMLINPFTATPSHGKRPVKVPNLKSLRLFPISHEHLKGFLPKCTVLKLDLLQDHQIYCFRACMCTLFSPEILQAGAVKGLNGQTSSRLTFLSLCSLNGPKSIRSGDIDPQS